MKLLALECSAAPVSVALAEEDTILAYAGSLTKITHSQTLLPLVEQVLAQARTTLDEVDALAVAAGPGSFTGVRIGIAAVKGLAVARDLPCVGVSTLAAMAELFRDTDCLVCAVMDARCHQVYQAFFACKNGVVTRLCEDRAVDVATVNRELSDLPGDDPIYLVGDGYALLDPCCPRIRPTGAYRQYQSAVGVALAGTVSAKQGLTVPAGELSPVYLRLPQAQRELQAKRSSLT